MPAESVKTCRSAHLQRWPAGQLHARAVRIWLIGAVVLRRKDGWVYYDGCTSTTAGEKSGWGGSGVDANECEGSGYMDS